MMYRGENSDSIPIDLILEIFSRLPAKSIMRFLFVSKLWGSMLRGPYFTELFLTRSSTLPRLLFAVQGSGEWSFFSSPQPQNPYRKPSLVVAADFHMKFRAEVHRDICCYASGLIYFPDMLLSKEDDFEDKITVPLICNPITGQYVILPKLRRYKMWYSFFGFDPIDNQFKVLFMAYPSSHDDHRILTLRTGKMRWRKIKCPLTPQPLCDGKGICINGVLYFLAWKIGVHSCVIVCFDVRSEKFKFIDSKCIRPDTTLINYKGKLGRIEFTNGDGVIELRMWVIEGVEKQKWLKHVYTLPENEVFNTKNFSVAGVTARGEIVLSMKYTGKLFYVFYFHPERNSLRRVEIQGFENESEVFAFVDHVEDLNVNHARQLKLGQVNQGLTIIRKMPNPQQWRHTSRDHCNSAPFLKKKRPTTLLQNN